MGQRQKPQCFCPLEQDIKKWERLVKRMLARKESRWKRVKTSLSVEEKNLKGEGMGHNTAVCHHSSHVQLDSLKKTWQRSAGERQNIRDEKYYRVKLWQRKPPCDHSVLPDCFTVYEWMWTMHDNCLNYVILHHSQDQLKARQSQHGQNTECRRSRDRNRRYNTIIDYRYYISTSLFYATATQEALFVQGSTPWNALFHLRCANDSGETGWCLDDVTLNS